MTDTLDTLLEKSLQDQLVLKIELADGSKIVSDILQIDSSRIYVRNYCLYGSRILCPIIERSSIRKLTVFNVQYDDAAYALIRNRRIAVDELIYNKREALRQFRYHYSSVSFLERGRR